MSISHTTRIDEVLTLHAGSNHAATPEGDETLLVRAAREEPAAFAELYRRYLHRVYRYMRAHTGSDEDAADLTQQIFLRALDALPRYRERGVPFAAWLFRIARNVATDAHRRHRPLLDLDQVAEARQPLSDDDPEAALLHDEALSHLRRLLARLDANKRELLMLRFAAGLTAKEIAAATGKSEAAVHKQIARTLQALKEEYNES